jgi:predicted O-methyltransferase YrrM
VSRAASTPTGSTNGATIASILAQHGVIVDEALSDRAPEQIRAPRTARQSAASQSASGLKGRARGAVVRGARSAAGRRLLLLLLRDRATLSWMLHRLSNWSSARASFDAAEAEGITAIAGFEDCSWLFASNPLNHGLARLELDEAAYIFRLIRSLDKPAVVEIGRYRGGTTFLLAAAGAERIVSIDNDPAAQAEYVPELAAALERFGLRDRVEIVVADSHSYDVKGSSFDLVFVDGDHSYDGVRADFEHWWPALAIGGHMLFHDAHFPAWDSRLAVAEGVVRFVDELARAGTEQRSAPGSLAHFVRASETVPDALLARVAGSRRSA